MLDIAARVIFLVMGLKLLNPDTQFSLITGGLLKIPFNEIYDVSSSTILDDKNLHYGILFILHCL